MTKHLAGLEKIICANEMRHLNGETHRRGTCNTAKQPRGRLYQTYGCWCLRTKAAYHRGVYKKHHHASHLCQNGRDAQSDNKIQFLTTGYRFAIPDCGQQYVCFLNVQCISFWVCKGTPKTTDRKILLPFSCNHITEKGGPNRRTAFLNIELIPFSFLKGWTALSAFQYSCPSTSTMQLILQTVYIIL